MEIKLMNEERGNEKETVYCESKEIMFEEVNVKEEVYYILLSIWKLERAENKL